MQIRLRVQVLAYVILLFALTYGLAQWLFFATRTNPELDPIRRNWALILMWLPALIALIVGFISREKSVSVGWKLPHGSYVALAIAIPLSVALLAWMIALGTGTTTYRPPDSAEPLFYTVHGWFVIQGDGFPENSALRLVTRFILALSIAMIPHCLYALGEELGWNGFMMPRLVLAGLPMPLWIGGFIWSQWHFPWLTLNPLWSQSEKIGWVLLFTLALTLLGVIIGWLRLASGSVWVAMLAHAAHNVSFGFTAWHSEGQWWWFTEHSIFAIVLYGSVVVYLHHSKRITSVTKLPT